VEARWRRAAGHRTASTNSEQAIALGWEFFGPLLTGMAGAMRRFGPGELETVGRFLRDVSAATHWLGG
jgi:hypothetical protein